jgi:deazaflavin-dependent oxidoreductase (nitroreductase family)
MGGSRRTPQWFLNLTAAGKARVRVGAQEHDVDPRVISDADREQLWPQIAARAPHFAKWQAKTGRTFPVAALIAHSP